MGRTKLAAVTLVAALGMSNMAAAHDAAPPSGKIFSASGAIPAGGSSVVITEIPESTPFLLTQFCRSGGDFGPALQASNFGGVPSGGGAGCTDYSPGVLLQGGQTLSCVAEFPSGMGDQCMVTGYRLKAP